MSAHFVQLAGLGLVAALGAAGCDPFTRIDFEDQTAVPPGDQVAYEGIRITEGRAIGVLATPMQGSDKMDEDTTVALTTNGANVAGISQSVQKHLFVVFGAAPGKTTFSVLVNDNVERDIPVEVLEAK